MIFSLDIHGPLRKIAITFPSLFLLFKQQVKVIHHCCVHLKAYSYEKLAEISVHASMEFPFSCKILQTLQVRYM